MTPDITAIAAKLSAAQRAALLHPEDYHDPNTIRSLRQRGLWIWTGPTPLGVAVRAYLEGQSK